MKRLFSVVLAATVVASVSTMARADDAHIAQQIVTRLRQQQHASQLQGFNIGIQVDQGSVTLMGQVASHEQATLALEITRRVPGVKLVINDLQVRPPVTAVGNSAAGHQGFAAGQHAFEARPSQQAPLPPQFAHLQRGQVQQPLAQSALATEQAASAYQPAPQPAARSQMPAPASIMAASPMPAPRPSSVPSTIPVANARPAGQGGPVPYAPAYSLMARQTAANMPGHNHGHIPGHGQAYMDGGVVMHGAGPVPVHPTSLGPGVVAPAYDNPQLPPYAWPTYAAYPNYGAVTYPRQYSATAWPYIGPFYPYPQVPLGWRRVSLEWDDGWWFLDFHAKGEH